MAFARVTITLGALDVCIESDQTYPDAISDMCNRATTMVGTSLAQAKASGVDIMEVYQGTTDEDDDEEEDA